MSPPGYVNVKTRTEQVNVKFWLSIVTEIKSTWTSVCPSILIRFFHPAQTKWKLLRVSLLFYPRKLKRSF